MADSDRVSNGKWSKTIQENDGARDNGYYRGNRRGGGHTGGASGGKPNIKIYRPGDGPLRRKTGSRDDECDNSNNNLAEDSHSPTREDGSKSSSGRAGNWRKPSQQLYQPPVSSRESTPGPSDIKFLSEKVSLLSTSPSENNFTDDRKKSKKPEQPIYVPKARAQALVSEHSGDSDGASGSHARSGSNKSRCDKEESSVKDGNRNRHEQSSKGSKGNLTENYQKSNKPEPLMQAKFDDRRGHPGKTENLHSKWEPPPLMSKSDTWEQPLKGSKNDLWERGKPREDFGDWRKPNRESNSGKGGRSSSDMGRAKRFPGNRRNNQHSEEGVRWRAASPLSNSSGMYRSESITGLSPSREIRQTSEPRSLPIDPSRHLRDTRSVEPQQPPPLPAMPPKPPSGRRGRDSKQVKTNLPPRFQKKAEMAANTTLDDWDGSKSLMFQGHSHTLPHPGSRGRGRQRHDERGDSGHGGHFTPAPSDNRNTRSLTPDQFKRPRTPPSLHHRAPSPKGRRTPDRHRNATPPGYPRRTPSQENLWSKGGRRTPRSQSPAQARDEIRRAPSQENVSKRHGGRRNASPHQSQRSGPQHQDHGRYRHRSGSNTYDNDPFYRNRRMSDSRPPVPSHGQRRPSLGSDDHKPSNSERQPQGAKQEDVALPLIPIPVIKDWSEEVEESERLQEAEAAASSSESSMQRHPSGSDTSRRKKKKKRRGGENRTGDEKDASHKSPSSNKVHNSLSEISSVSNKSPSNQHHPLVPGPHRGGLIILPPQATEASPNFIPHMMSHPLPSHPHQQHQQRALFDPSNPNKPILVMAGGMRVTHPGHPQFAQFNHPPTDMPPRPAGPYNNQMPTVFPPSPFAHGFPQKLPIGPDMNAPHAAGDPMMGARPNWYDHYSDSFRACRNPHLLIDMERADWDLTCILSTMGPLPRWGNVSAIRQFLMKSLHTLLMAELKFCQVENVEHHIWKVVFYNVIELLRKGAADDPNTERRASHKQTLLAVLEEGVAYFENLLEALQQTYKFSLDRLTGPNAPPFTPHGNKEAPFTNLAIISAQKICLFLGDLARYKDQASDTPSSTYSKARQWYTKAQILNPKNGRPYNQLALLALYARRKLDAVYFYMRSLMASNPFQTARESLLGLFDENRKKFESLEKRRREERSAEARERQKEKEALGKGFRREIWVHPDNGQREWRTTSNREKSPDARDEELERMPLPEVNRQFVTSYLHVQGKLFTKVGMETFQEAAVQMLREFRALLQHSPVPVSCARFLQLLALNMFAIENTQLRDTDLEPGYRSAMQECALVMSLQMFNLILERCASLFPEPSTSIPAVPPQPIEVSEDLQTLLPAVKVWCDWLLCHKSVWNPPPSCADYCVGPAGDAWNRLAKLLNQLERLDLSAVEFACEDIEGFELVKLPEDSALAGFTPLMYNIQELVYAKEDSDQDLAQNCLRVKKVQFFGTVFLCGVDPPVLKLQKFDNERSLYVSVVQDNNSSSGSSSAANTSRRQSSENLLETGDDDHPGENGTASSSRTTCSPSEATPSDIRNLLNRKEELTRTHQTQERHRQQVQAILEQQAAAGGVEVEVRPRLLVADTNCFIDHLAALQRLLTHAYSLMVPLVVLHELEGLSKGGKSPSTPATAVGPDALRHAQHVAECATAALTFVKGRHTGLRCVTTLGTVLASANFTLEEDTGDQDVKNDDRILNTCVSLIKSNSRGDEPPPPAEGTGERRHLYREVVLLTEDRNLRVKALARDVPVRDLPDFLAWAKLK